MARGWESKSVEDQIREREAERQNAAGARLTGPERERRARRESLLLARTRVQTAIESTRDQRYRTLLQKSLDHLDEQLERLESLDRGSPQKA